MSDFTLNDIMPLLPPTKRREKGRDGYYRYLSPCPICGGTDRFMIADIGGKILWRCRQEYTEPAHRTCTRGKPLGHSQYHFGDNLYEIITGEKWKGDESWKTGEHKPFKAPAPPPPLPPSYDAMLNHVEITLDRVEWLHRAGVEKAVRYYSRRGITEASVRKYKLGYVEGAKDCSLPAGYTLPNISYGPNGIVTVRGVDVRRDDKACIRALAEMNPLAYNRHQMDIYKSWKGEVEAGIMPPELLHTPTDNDIMNVLYPKYKALTTSENGIWGDDLVTLPDKSRFGPHLLYVFVVESANDAILLRQLGFYAVAYKPRNDWNYWLPTVFRHIKLVYIIGDRDEQFNNVGVGQYRASTIEQAIAKGKLSVPIVVLPPDGIKDPGEMAEKHGVEAVANWLQGINPIIQPELIVETAA